MRPDEDQLPIPAIAADGGLYPAPKLEVHRTGQQHVAVSVFVFCGDELLIQKRADGKYHSAGKWANTCCTHPHWGETPAACARRRLAEEVGLDLDLVPGGIVDYRAEVGNGLIENERVNVFFGRLTRKPATLAFDPAEVSALRWIALDDLRREVRSTPERFSAWLAIYLDRWSELAIRPAA